MNKALQRHLTRASTAIKHAKLRPLCGVVHDVKGPILRIGFAEARVGEICEIGVGTFDEPILGRVIALEGEAALVSPFTDAAGLSVGALVQTKSSEILAPSGDGVLGRVLDGLGRPIDGLGALPQGTPYIPARADAPPPMSRQLIDSPLITGLRVIDTAMTLGKGQRIGIFGSPGTGKSTLLSALSQHSEADVIVIGMIGERGREIREFLERQLPQKKRAHITMVVATSDRAPMERVYGAHIATAIAESFRDQGKSVLLLIDSLTRVARALREVGLAAGEQPTRRGYPASVYPALPELIERAGSNDFGHITALYTVLVEGDGSADPIAEETKSLTDGHIVLSQEVADSGRYPSVDVVKSLSRVMKNIVPESHNDINAKVRSLYAKYAEIEMLIQIGEYQTGADKIGDQSLNAVPKLNRYFSQSIDEKTELNDALKAVESILNDG